MTDIEQALAAAEALESKRGAATKGECRTPQTGFDIVVDNDRGESVAVVTGVVDDGNFNEIRREYHEEGECYLLSVGDRDLIAHAANTAPSTAALLRRLAERVGELEAIASEAVEEFGSAYAYAGDYFIKKWGMDTKHQELKARLEALNTKVSP